MNDIALNEAKNRFSELIRRVEAGEEISILDAARSRSGGSARA